MGRYDDIDPSDIDPETGAPYANYSSPALDTSFHDHEMDVDDPPDVELSKLLQEWKCSCTGGFYLQRSRAHPARMGEWVACRRCGGSGLDPRAEKALQALGRLAPSDDDDGYPPRCSSRHGHSWVCSGSAYGGDDDRWHGEGRMYCEHCGADGDA